MNIITFVKYKFRALKVHILTFFPKQLADYYYKQCFGYKIDWEKPRDLNEWINVLMHTTDTSLWTKLADKYRVREYVIAKGLERILVPLYGMWKSPEDIDETVLPDKFVLKANNGNESVLICDNTPPEVYKTKAKEWLKQGFGRIQNETHYTKIQPCIIAEKYLDSSKQDIDSTSLIDYKIWCINGVPQYVMTMYDRIKKTVAVNLYDTHWNNCDNFVNFGSHFIKGSGIPKPTKLREMIDIAKTLSTGFPEIRVDLYFVDKNIYFGELTFSSNGGRMKYFKPEFLKLLGDKIRL